MGANAVTSVPVYADGEVLEASRLNVTNSGIPVFATTTTRDAAFGGTGEKTLAEGQMAYIENVAGSAAVQYYDGAAWATLVTSGLTLISATTVGTGVATVTVSDVFSSTYDNYRIIYTGGVGSTNQFITLAIGNANTAYYWSYIARTFGDLTDGARGDNDSKFGRVGYSTTGTNFLSCDVFAPNLAKNTTISYNYIATVTTGGAGQGGGLLNNTTQYTSFTLTVTGTLTGGTIRVYGYQNS
jgi:hypothetical protein